MNVLEMLEVALKTHDIGFRSDGRSVTIEGSDLMLEPRVFERETGNGDIIVQLDVIAYSSILGNRFINESIAGFGGSREEAEKNAFGKFLIGPFHVLVTVLANHACESNPAAWEDWGSAGASWSICEGPALIHGSNSGQEALSSFYPELRELFLKTQTREVHWVRTFVSSFSGKLQAFEVLLDNEPWSEAIELVAKFDWRPEETYGSIRHFLLALPE